MTRIRFVWEDFGEFILIDPETLFNHRDEPFYRAYYVFKGKRSDHKGDFPFRRASHIETLPDQLVLA